MIIDPPRAGIDNKIINYILEKSPNKIIYVSCDPSTFIRDIKELKEKYEVKKISMLDMFSYTFHVESVCVLERK